MALRASSASAKAGNGAASVMAVNKSSAGSAGNSGEPEITLIAFADVDLCECKSILTSM